MSARLRLELRVKNLELWRAIHSLHGSVAEFCRANGRPSSNGLVGELLALRTSPYGKNKFLIPTAQWLCDVTGLGHDALFPPELYAKLLPKLFVAEAPADRLLSLSEVKQLAYTPNFELGTDQGSLEKDVQDALRTLTKREESVITRRFGLSGEPAQTLEEIGNDLGVGRERVRSIQAKALRKLAHPSRSRKLKAFLMAHDGERV